MPDKRQNARHANATRQPHTHTHFGRRTYNSVYRGSLPKTRDEAFPRLRRLTPLCRRLRRKRLKRLICLPAPSCPSSILSASLLVNPYNGTPDSRRTKYREYCWERGWEEGGWFANQRFHEPLRRRCRRPFAAISASRRGNARTSFPAEERHDGRS